jgi:carboxylesterase
MTDRSYRYEASKDVGVLLIHGLTGTPLEMKHIAKRLYQRGFTVHVPQLAGHGVDDSTLLRTTWRDWYQSVDEAYRKLSQDVSRVCAAGICVGGALAVALAAEHPDVARIGVYSPTFRYDGWNMSRWFGYAPILAPFADLPLIRRIRIEEPFPFGLKDKRIRERVANMNDNTLQGALTHLTVGSLLQMHRLGEHLEGVSREVRAPALILHARDDDMSAPRNAYKLRDMLPGESDLRLLDDCYHMIHVDRSRDEVAALTGDFFEKERVASPVQRHQHA